METTEGLEQRVAQQLSEVRERVDALMQRLAENIRKHPGASLLAALALGYIVGMLARRS